MNLFVGGAGTCMAFFGVFMNLYVIIVLLLNKKARTSSEWILLHLSWCGLGASFFNLCLISPSIFMARWLTSTGSLCSLVGASVLTLQLLTVWSICALSADRCAAIASPLRYTQLVTGRRVAIFFLFIWVLSIGSAMAAFIVSSLQESSSLHSYPAAPTSVRMPANNLKINETTHSVSNFSHVPNFSLSSSDTRVSDQPKSQSRTIIHMPSLSESSTTATAAASGGSSSSPMVANMIFELASQRTRISKFRKYSNLADDYHTKEVTVNYTDTLLPSLASGSGSMEETTTSIETNESSTSAPADEDVTASESLSEFRKAMGLCLPRVYYTSLPSVVWVSEWIFVILVAPLCTILICDLVVLSIARKQRHRIVMALYQITLSAQATVVRKGTTPPQLWLNRSIPARSRAVRAVFEDFLSLTLIHLPLILILVFEMLADDHHAPVVLHFLGSFSLFVSPSFTALLYGIRARSLRAAYKSYIRKRMTNNTLQHEIQQRLSPVDGGSPRPSSGAKSFRSCTPSPASSPIQTPRRLSTNDLRPPPMHFPMNTCSSPVSPLPGPNTSTIISNDGTHFFMEHVSNHHNSLSSSSYNKCDDGDNNSYTDGNHGGDNGFLGGGTNKPRKIRSFLHLPSQHDMQEFWSGLSRSGGRPNRSPTIIITHELRMKDQSSNFDSKSIVSSPTAEQRL